MSKTVGLDKAGMEAAVDFLHASSQYTMTCVFLIPCAVRFIVCVCTYRLLYHGFSVVQYRVLACILIYGTACE